MALVNLKHINAEGTKVFPPLIPAAMLLLAWGLDQRLPFWEMPLSLRILGVVFALLGASLMTWAIVHQYKRGTDPNPFNETSALVTDGPYRYSRNPIYLADLLLQTGIGAAFAFEWTLPLLAVTWLGLRVLVIRNEERYLAELFGDEYLEYRQRVRRWL